MHRVLYCTVFKYVYSAPQ